jgi:hypothetical protein
LKIFRGSSHASFLSEPCLARQHSSSSDSHTLSGTFFFLLYQPLSITENPFDQRHQRHAFVQDYFSLRSSAPSLLLASVVPNAPIFNPIVSSAFIRKRPFLSRHQRHAFISPDLPLRPLW